MNNTCRILLLVVVVAVLGAAAAEQEAACDIDKAGSTLNQNRNLPWKFLPCFMSSISAERINSLKNASHFETYREFFKEFCTNVESVALCMSRVREKLSHCDNKTMSLPVNQLLKIAEAIMREDCQQDGVRLARIVRGIDLVSRKKENFVPLRRCLIKAITFIELAAKFEGLDTVSENYIIYHEMPKLRKCLEHVDDEDYKDTGEWFFESLAKKLMCHHPDDETLTLCASFDEETARRVPFHDVCRLAPLVKGEGLFKQLEDMAAVDCFKETFSHDLIPDTNYMDLNWLRGEYRRFCRRHSDVPDCLLKTSAFGDACLPPDQNKELQVEVQTMEDAMLRNCVHDGDRLAAVMHQIYSNTAKHGHALRDCYVTVHSVPHDGRDNKNMKFYKDTIAYKHCVVEKLHETNHLAKNVETAFNDVLKKMKCVNAEDGAIVLCETLHHE